MFPEVYNAGVEGIEPPNELLESSGMPLTYTPVSIIFSTELRYKLSNSFAIIAS